jgi:dienelactone hydrolase
MSRRLLLLATLACLRGIRANAQEPRFAFPPPSAAVTVSQNLPYGTSGDVLLQMDVYRPAVRSPHRLPALIFFNRATGADRSGAFYAAWARTTASRGVIAILPDLRSGSEAQDCQALLDHLAAHAAELGIDREALALYAGSGNVFTAFPLVENPSQTAIKAAVMYYGTAPVTEFRRDLPVLYVRAGLDRPDVNQEITRLAALAVSQNAPVRLVNHSSGHHAFEMVDDDDASRAVIELTIDFVRQATAPAYQAAIRRAIPEATAAGYVLTGDFTRAATIYADLVAGRPDDARLRLSYGEALSGSARYADACAEFEKLKGKGLGPRDLGLPAARACMQKGDGDAAIAWLRSIPSRFLPAAVADEPVFAALRDRPDFRALFAPR